MSFNCGLYVIPHDPRANGGYISICDDNTESNLHLEKDGVVITLNDSEILQLINTLRGYVS